LNYIKFEWNAGEQVSNKEKLTDALLLIIHN